MMSHYKLIEIKNGVITNQIEIDSIQVIPSNVDLLFELHELTSDADFAIAQETILRIFRTETRNVAVCRKGDLSITGIAK